jgi:Prokaryotic membrane lipoprotein lipid attachment site
MRKLILATMATLALAGCSTGPRPLVPDTAEGPASYVCYASWDTSPEDVRAIAERQCGRWGLPVGSLIGQEFAPLRCGTLTPTVAAFSCGRPTR